MFVYNLGKSRDTEEHRNGRFAPEQNDGKNNPKYLLYKIIVVPLQYDLKY